MARKSVKAERLHRLERPSPVQCSPGPRSIAFGGSDDMEQTIATRRQLAERAADLGALLIAAHVPFPHAVGVWRDGQNMRFAAAFGNPGNTGEAR
jgi:hypothetical protein